MAKGDNERIRDTTDYYTKRSEDKLDNLWAMGEDHMGDAANTYFNARNQNAQDYSNIMSRFQNFADTGGYTPQEEALMRERMTAPSRAVYSNAMRNVSRNRAIQGNTGPGYGALMSRFAREQSQAQDDSSIAAEAQLAQMKSQNKLAGMQGMTSAYGTTPAMAALYGNMFNRQWDNSLGMVGLQNDIGKMNIQGYSAGANAPTGWDSFKSFGQGIAGIGQGISGAATPWGPQPRG